MTMIMVNDGIFRASPRSDGRGRRKRRGEFLPVHGPLAESGSIRSAASPERPTPETPRSAPNPASEGGLSELRLQQEREKDTLVLRVSGALDLSTILPFRDAVFTAIGQKPGALVIDLTNIQELDIAAISSLVTAGRVAGLMKVPFSIIPSAQFHTLLSETGLRRAVPVTTKH
ncbi:MAG: STAS domain-containing protein [Cytophagales bacterium]|nr:STAS domain-containing protein [Armatimonadota bacterium]